MKKINANKKNFLKKIFIKLCRLFGFESIDQSNFKVVTSNKFINENLSIPGKVSTNLPLGRVQITRSIKSLDVILRTCMSVNMLTQSKNRMFEKNKEEYTKRTLISLVNNINHAKKIFKNINFKFYIIDHNSSNDQLKIIRNILDKSNINFEIMKLEFEKFSKYINPINQENKKVTNNQMSNMSNIHQLFCYQKKRVGI